MAEKFYSACDVTDIGLCLIDLELHASFDEPSDALQLELGRGRGISNLDKKARITRPAPLI